MPELQILNGDLQWKTVRMDGGRFLIGRKDECHLVLKDGWVSREHTLVFEPRSGEFFVKDLGSENGTYLNGERIDEGRLKSGDVLRIGRTEMRFVARTSSSETPVRLASPNVDSNRTASRAFETTMADEPETTPAGARDAANARVGVDLRERVRRFEKRVLELEMENARLATENAVLRRATVRPTSAPKRAHAAPAFVGLGAAGGAMIAALHARGASRARTVTMSPLDDDELAKAFAAVDAAARPTFLCADCGQLDGASLERALTVAHGAGASGVYGFFLVPEGGDRGDRGDGATVEATFGVIRELSEAGRLRGTILRSDARPEDAIESLAAVLHGPSSPSPEGGKPIAWEDLFEILSAPGYAVSSVAPCAVESAEAAASAARAAVDVGAFVRLAPTARARAAAAWFMIASGPSSAGRLDVPAWEAALYPILELLPQARIRRGLHVYGERNAAVALVGGLTFPSRVYGERA